MLGDVQTDELFLLADAEADGGFEDQEDQNGSYCGEGGSDGDTDELVDQLAAASGEGDDLITLLESGGDQRIHCWTGEQPEHDHPDRAADTMDPKDVERIVVAEPRLEMADSIVANHSSKETDQERGRNGYEAGGGSDRGEAGDHA